MNSILAIASLGFLIIVHEAGHLFIARLCGMRVERFSIGFGPGILKKKSKKSGTTYQLAPIPFGGFVEIAGMNIADEVDPADAQAYPNRPAWQRFATIFAGPATNFVSAVFLAFLLYNCHGVEGTTWHVGALKPGYDAATKLQVGDRIIAVDGKALFSPSSTKLTEAINATKEPTVHLRVLRASSFVVELDVKKTADIDKGKTIYRIGIINDVDTEDVGVIESAGRALRYPFVQTAVILKGLRDIILGTEEARPTSVVGIYEEFRKAYTASWIYGVELLMLLSVYLGLVNLFPLPALDGGRLVFLTYEMVTRRRANPKIEAMVHMGGFMVLGVVLILVTLNDLHIL